MALESIRQFVSEKLIQPVVKVALKITHRRSGGWPAVRAQHLKREGWCRVCGSVVSLEAHHIIPFSVNPSLELNPGNLITICDRPETRCHLRKAHLGSWRRYNPNICREATAPKPADKVN